MGGGRIGLLMKSYLICSAKIHSWLHIERSQPTFFMVRLTVTLS